MFYLLDTTLRDGGYIIDWAFGKDKTTAIIKKLNEANIDFIEIGFLKNNPQKNQTTVFKNIDEAKKYIKNYDLKKFSLMIKAGEFDIESLNQAQKEDIFLRYIFKKKTLNSAFEDCKKIIKKGYKLAINPVFIDEYSDSEYIEIIKKFETLNPFVITVVDSIGIMDKSRIRKLFSTIDNEIKQNIKLGFHCHNNTEGAFINALELLRMNFKRDIIIDCAVSGMGRGAGNLCSEIISKHLNSNLNKNYNISLLENIVDNELDEFYKKTPWGNSYPYYLCAIYKCHPDYAGYFIKNNLDYKKMEEILNLIPYDKRDEFDNTILKKLL